MFKTDNVFFQNTKGDLKEGSAFVYVHFTLASGKQFLFFEKCTHTYTHTTYLTLRYRIDIGNMPARWEVRLLEKATWEDNKGSEAS